MHPPIATVMTAIKGKRIGSLETQSCMALEESFLFNCVESSVYTQKSPMVNASSFVFHWWYEIYSMFAYVQCTLYMTGLFISQIEPEFC